jgi:hypothetical protein
MCGRYRLSRRKQLVEEYFDSAGEEDWVPRYNVAPTQPVPIIRQNPKEPRRELSLVLWGLIPWWAKDPSGAAGMINARSETAATKPAFRDALKLRRCLQNLVFLCSVGLDVPHRFNNFAHRTSSTLPSSYHLPYVNKKRNCHGNCACPCGEMGKLWRTVHNLLCRVVGMLPGCGSSFPRMTMADRLLATP